MQPRITPVVLNLIILNVLVWLLWQFMPPDIMRQFFILWKVDLLHPRPDYYPYGFLPLQLVTWFFSQQSFIHLLFNMLWLFFMGPVVEMVMNSRRFLAFYLYAGLGSGVAVAVFDPSQAPVLGASGAVSAMMMAFAFYFPNMKMSLLFFPFVRFKAIHMALALFAYSGYMVIFVEDQAGISHFGHLMGMIAGILYFVVDQKNLRRPW